MNVGENLRIKRIEQGLTQNEVAKAIGVGRTTISSWEVNRTEPSIGDIEKLANLYHCLKTDLIGADTTDFLKLTSKEEIELIKAFRSAPNDTKDVVKRMFAYEREFLKHLNRKGDNND